MVRGCTALNRCVSKLDAVVLGEGELPCCLLGLLGSWRGHAEGLRTGGGTPIWHPCQRCVAPRLPEAVPAGWPAEVECPSTKHQPSNIHQPKCAQGRVHCTKERCRGWSAASIKGRCTQHFKNKSHNVVRGKGPRHDGYRCYRAAMSNP